MAQRLALIIGNSVYRDETLARIKAPEADVGALAEILETQEIGGFDQVRTLFNRTAASARRAIAELFARRQRDDLILLYFTGHGVLDENGQLFLALSDTDARYLRATAIPARDISEEMDNSASRRQVVVLDCCHSGAFGRGSKGTPGLTVGTAAAFEGTGYGRVVLTASDATQYAWEGNKVVGEAEGSLFTHYLIDGIATGDADLNRDGQITVDELYDYVYDAIVQRTSRQTPGKWSYREQGEIVIARSTPPPSAQPVAMPPLEDQLPRRLAQLYAMGLSASMLGEWGEAERYFQAVKDLDPEYRDTASLLADAKQNLTADRQYQLGLERLRAGDYRQAATHLEQASQARPQDKDIASYLAQVQTALKLEALVEQAQMQFQAGHWQQVIQTFAEITKIDAQYPDPEGLLPAAKERLAEEQRLEALQAAYERALQAIQDHKLEVAQRELEAVQHESPGYLETDRLLASVRGRIAAEAAQRAQEAQVEPVHRRVRTARPLRLRWPALHAISLKVWLIALLPLGGLLAGVVWWVQTPHGNILYVSEASGDREIHLVNSVIRSDRNLTNNPADDFDPVWSPDGRWIYFVSNRDGNNEIYRMDTRGDRLQNLTQDAAKDEHPRISPDGQWLLYNHWQNDFNNYVRQANGSQPRRLTSNPEDEYGAVWSPASDEIAFITQREGKAVLALLEFDKPHVIRLLNTGLARPDSVSCWLEEPGILFWGILSSGSRYLYSIRPDGSDQKIVGYGPYTDCDDFSWSPGRSWYAYVGRTAEGGYQLNAIHAARNAGYVMIQSGIALESPRWQP